MCFENILPLFPQSESGKQNNATPATEQPKLQKRVWFGVRTSPSTELTKAELHFAPLTDGRTHDKRDKGRGRRHARIV